MKERNAYFTVEATLVLPIVMGVILIMIYLWLYQYDRCIMEQDMGRLALWGCETIAQGNENMAGMIEDKLAEVDGEIYIGWQCEEQKATLDKNVFTAKAGGTLTMPFAMLNGENVWGAEAAYSFDRIDRVSFVRLCNRLANAKDTAQE